ncbi:MAG: glycosyltransferase family 4 protein [Chloroflexi bacterium]|nr:glycosyltransferase family 4 protein [Chloroflexota bacterium]
MKVLHVIQRYWPYTGGSERHLQEISERLVRDGLRVTVFTTDALDLELFWDPRKERVRILAESHNGVEIRRFRVHHLPGGRLAFGAVRRSTPALALLPLAGRLIARRLARITPWVPDLARALARLDDDYALIHGMNICFESLLLPALAAARRRHIPFVVTPLIHLGESPRSVVRRYYTMPHQIELIARADAVLAQTPIEVDYLVQRGVDPRRIVLAGVGVNPTDVLGGQGHRFRAAHELTAPLVSYIGTAAYDKGTVHLVEAMRRLWAHGSDAELILAGPMLDAFRSYLASLPPGDRRRIHALGMIPEAEKRDLLDATAVVAMPSRTDSFGIVYLEGWLYQKPVIGARAGGVPAVITDGVDGFLVEFGDVTALAERIERLLRDPALARAMGARGQAKVLERYTWDRIYPTVRAVYERLGARALRRP